VKFLRLSLVLALVVTVAAARAQDAKGTGNEPPKAPDGWKYFTARDRSYRFLVPDDGKHGTRDRTFKGSGASGRAQVDYFTLKGDTVLTVTATNLSGPAVRNMKLDDAVKQMIDNEKESGGTVSEPKDVTVGSLVGKEFTVTSPKDATRVNLFFVKGRTYLMSVAAKDKDKLTGETADTFLKSLIVTGK
jgi:hypothetical protein